MRERNRSPLRFRHFPLSKFLARLFSRRTLLLGVSLALVTLFIVHGIGKGEFNINVDETMHASTGLYVASFLRDLPLRHPIDYTYLYYAQYPALNIPLYPPFFYVAEGLMFATFGPSVIVARLTVLLFALFGFYFWFLLVAKLEDDLTAAAATILVASLPSVLLYEKSAMLEIPAMAICLAASYFWVRYLREGAPRLMYSFAFLAGLALMTKQQSIYLGVWCLASAIALGKWRLILNRATAIGMGICAVMAVPYYMLSFKMTGAVAKANVFQGTGLISHPLSYYFEILPSEIGWVILGLSILGTMSLALRGKRENYMLVLTWILACYITQTAFANKEPRYIIYWIPAFVYLAIVPLAAMLRRPSPARWAGAAALSALLLTYSAIAWTFQRPYVTGYADLAKRIVNKQGGFVLISAPLPGNFIFFVRAFDPARRFVLDRKALSVERAVKAYGYLEFAHSTEDVENIIRDNGYSYIVVDPNMRIRFESERFLLEVLKKPEFHRVAEVMIDSNLLEYTGHRLLLYENNAVAPSSAQSYRAKTLQLDHDIVVSRAELRLASLPRQ